MMNKCFFAMMGVLMLLTMNNIEHQLSHMALSMEIQQTNQSIIMLESK